MRAGSGSSSRSIPGGGGGGASSISSPCSATGGDGSLETARSINATSTQATSIRKTIERGLSRATAAPVATRMRNAASAAKRSRADEVSAQRPSLLLLFTVTLGRLLAPLTRPEHDPAAAWPRSQRLEAVARPPVRLGEVLLRGRLDRRWLSGRLRGRLDHRLFLRSRRRRGRGGGGGGLFGG